MKVLLTGGSGFIGTSMLDNLIQDGNTVLNIDKAAPLKKGQDKYWQQVDILDYGKFEAAAVQFDPEIIIHLAAVTDLEGKDLLYYSTNIQGTRHLIDIASKLTSLKKLVFTSSMYVCEPGFIPADYDTYKPHTLYGESKVKAELLVKNIQFFTGTADYPATN